MPDGAATSTETRVAPNDLDAEGLVLSHAFEHGTGSMPALRPEHFYADANRHIFAAIKACEERGEPHDPVAVLRELRFRGRADQVGGSQYLLLLVGSIPYVVPSQVNAHANAIIEFWKRRVLLVTAQTIVAELYGGGLSSADTWTRFKEVCDANRDL